MCIVSATITITITITIILLLLLLLVYYGVLSMLERPQTHLGDDGFKAVSTLACHDAYLLDTVVRMFQSR